MKPAQIPDKSTGDTLPVTPLFDRNRNHAGYAMNKMASSLGRPENREAFKADEAAYLARYKLTEAQREAVLSRDWNEMMRQGGNLFYILKISALDPIPLTVIGAAQAGMTHEEFLRDRLGKH